jgi:hypothetical protein
MNIKKLVSRTISFIGLVGALITIADHVSFHLNHKKEQDTTVTVDEPKIIINNPQENLNDPHEIIKEPKERTFIGQLWHDAFSDEKIPFKERWATRVERENEIDGVLRRFAFDLFYFPIPGIIILILSCLIAALFASYCVDHDKEIGKSSEVLIMSGTLGALIGFAVSLFFIEGTYSLIVWGIPFLLANS